MTKRKTRDESTTRCPPLKRRQTSRDTIVHQVLSRHYPQVLTLRAYLLSHVSASSRTRRKRLQECYSESSSLATTLDTTLVGVLQNSSVDVQRARNEHFRHFSQSQQESTNSTARPCSSAQIRDVCPILSIWHLPAINADYCLGHFILYLAVVSANRWYSQAAISSSLQWLLEDQQVWSSLWRPIF